MGILLLHRAQSERQFTPKEERIFSDLIPYFAHAVKKSTDAKPLFIDSRNQGVLIFDQQGKLQHLSPEGRRLLFLATHPKIGTDHVDVEVSQVVIPQELVRLCQKLAGLFNNGGRSGNPPVWRHNNRWGKFVFRGQWLEFADGSGNGHIAVTVQQQKPLLLIVLDRSEEFGLTPKQAEICQLMVAGHSYESIAERTNVTRYTVIDHVRRIYERLAVKNRSELITKLMAD